MDIKVVFVLILIAFVSVNTSRSDLESDWESDGSDSQSESEEVDGDLEERDGSPWWHDVVGTGTEFKPTVVLDAKMVKCACPHTHNAQKYLENIQEAMDKFRISKSKERAAAFLAQTCHESGHYPDQFNEKWTIETTCSKSSYRVAKIYEGAVCKWFGRGAIQITEKQNYRDCGKFFGQDFVASPDPVATQNWAFKTAGWWWQIGSTIPNCDDLNHYMDKGLFDETTRCIFGNNYKTQSWAENGKRRALYRNALKCL